MHVVADPERERAVDLVEIRQRLFHPRGAAAELPQQQVGLELLRPGNHLAAGVDYEAVAVEDKLVLASDEVAEGDRDAVGAGTLGEHALAIGALTAQIG